MTQEIYWIANLATGRMGIAPRPRGGDWLDDEVQAWREAGVNCVVSALTSVEEEELSLANEKTACLNHGMQFLSLPILDRGTPGSMISFQKVLSAMISSLECDKTIIIHCRQGIGRSSLIAAAALVAAGESPNQAFSRIGQARGCSVPETDKQRDWVQNFAEQQKNVRTHQPFRRVVLPEVHA